MISDQAPIMERFFQRVFEFFSILNSKPLDLQELLLPLSLETQTSIIKEIDAYLETKKERLLFAPDHHCIAQHLVEPFSKQIDEFLSVQFQESKKE